MKKIQMNMINYLKNLNYYHLQFMKERPKERLMNLDNLKEYINTTGLKSKN